MEEAGIEAPRGFVQVNDKMQVLDKPDGEVVPHLYCIGDANGIPMYGYLGQPRAYAREDTPCGQPFDLNWDHGAVSEFDRYYGEMADAGFIGVGFDASIHQPADSPWLVNIVPELERRGMDMFLESIPKRSHPHLLGHHVCAENRIWDIFGSQDSIWYTDDEI